MVSSHLINNDTCHVFKNPTRKEYKEALGKNDQVRVFLVENDILVWNVFESLHQGVRKHFNLNDDAIPLVIYGSFGGDVGISLDQYIS